MHSIIKYIRFTAHLIASLEVWLVVPLVAATWLSERTFPLALGVAMLFWGMRWLAYGRPTIPTPVEWPVVLLLLMLPVTLWITAFPDVTRVQVYRLLTGIALCYALANWSASAARLRLLLAGTLLAGLGLALVAPLSSGWRFDLLPAQMAALYAPYAQHVSDIADTINPNVIAGQLIILLPIPLAMLLWGGRWLDWGMRLVALPVVLVMTGILLLTQSRGALVALGAVLITMIMLRWRYGWFVLLMTFIVSGIAVHFGDTRFILEAVMSNQTVGAVVARLVDARLIPEAVISNQTTGGVEVRMQIWARAISMIQDFPLTGVGMGAFPELTSTMYPVFVIPGKVDHAHNLFLQVAVDLGIPGLIAWLSILLLVCVAAWQVYRHGVMQHNGWLAGAGAGLLASQVALVVHGLTDAVTWGMVRPAPLVWGIWGLTLAAWNITSSDVQQAIDYVVEKNADLYRRLA